MPKVSLKLEKKHLFAAAITLSMALLGFFYFKLYKPMLVNTRQTAKQVSEKKRDITQSQDLSEKQAKLEREIRVLNKKIERYQEGLEQRADIPKLLSELNKLADEIGVKLVSIKPGESTRVPIPDTEQYFLEIPIEIEIKSGYHQFGRFVNKIENSRWVIRIEEFSIKRASGEEWIHDIDLNLSVYALGGRAQ